MIQFCHLQIVMLFVSACTWKNSQDPANDVESEEASTKPISDQSNIICERKQKTNKF